jgi:hypothetical protein
MTEGFQNLPKGILWLTPKAPARMVVPPVVEDFTLAVS